jgi:serine/threonine protein kinase
VPDDGTVKVLDFGIAAILRRDVTKITVTGAPMGTSRYMSPEQVNAAQVTPQSDLYGLGCVLHELLAGAPVFDGKSEFELWKQHSTAEPERLSKLRPEVQPELEELVLDLLAKKPEQRPADAYTVYERLLPFLPSPGSPALTTSRRLGEMPDPTLLYRQPNAPRRRTSRPSPIPAPPTVPHAPTTPPTQLRNAIDDALKRSTQLLGSERFAQAADVVEAVIGPAAKMLGSESPDLLKLRFHRALILYLGGDSRMALPEFDALSDAYARTAGPSSDRALESRRYAALCRANLGQNTVALDQFRRLLEDVANADSHASELALDIRHSIGMLLLSAGDKAAAENVFETLYQDHLVLNGPDDERTREIADILIRIRLPTSP